MKNFIVLYLVVISIVNGQPANILFTSSNLPIVIINTHGQTILNEPKITADMGIIFNGEGKRNNLTDSLNHYNGKIGIEIRGSSSQQFPKKQYGFETRDSLGNDISVSFFGMPSESDWILSAQYNDKTLMRDVITYSLSNSIGRYASRTRFCELVLNGEYRGVYMLFEKIKRDKNRVNVSKLDSTGVTGDALTGGYIIKIDKLDGSGNDGWYSYFPPRPNSPFRVYYQYHYPKPEDITAGQKEYIKNFVLSYETELYRTSYADTSVGYPKYFDVPSMIDYFLINELSKNVDGYRLSLFLHKDKNSKNPKLFFGPVWDFNHGFGNCNYYDASEIEGWQLEYFRSNQSFITTDHWPVPFWWGKIFDDTSFLNQANMRWESLRKNQFSISRINTFIDSVATHINEAQQRNFEKWPILNTYVWPNVYIGGTYANEVVYLKKWIAERIHWMDMQLAGRSLTIFHSIDNQPHTLLLNQNYPNPFNPSTIIRYQLPITSNVSLKIYDLLGREVATLVNEEQSAGWKEVEWNASGFSSGIIW